MHRASLLGGLLKTENDTDSKDTVDNGSEQYWPKHITNVMANSIKDLLKEDVSPQTVYERLTDNRPERFTIPENPGKDWIYTNWDLVVWPILFPHQYSRCDGETDGINVNGNKYTTKLSKTIWNALNACLDSEMDDGTVRRTQIAADWSPTIREYWYDYGDEDHDLADLEWLLTGFDLWRGYWKLRPFKVVKPYNLSDLEKWVCDYGNASFMRRLILNTRSLVKDHGMDEASQIRFVNDVLTAVSDHTVYDNDGKATRATSLVDAIRTVAWSSYPENVLLLDKSYYSKEVTPLALIDSLYDGGTSGYWSTDGFNKLIDDIKQTVDGFVWMLFEDSFTTGFRSMMDGCSMETFTYGDWEENQRHWKITTANMLMSL